MRYHLRRDGRRWLLRPGWRRFQGWLCRSLWPGSGICPANFRGRRRGWFCNGLLNPLRLAKVTPQTRYLRFKIPDFIHLFFEALIQTVTQFSRSNQGNNCHDRNRQDAAGQYHHNEFHVSPSTAETCSCC